MESSFPWLEEADITKYIFTPVPVKSEEEDVQKLLVVKEEVPPEQQECSSRVDQEEPEAPPHIKEEQEELWSSQEGEQLLGLEEADITKFPFTPVPVKSEDDEEEDVEQLLVVKEEVPPKQQELSFIVDQREPESPPHIKEKQEEPWSSQEGEQLHGLEEADITKFSFPPVPVKSEDDEEEDGNQLSVVKEEVPPEQQECSSSVDQEEPEAPPHIKEEQEELWSSQEGEQLQGLEEADITKFPFTPVPVKSEDDEEEAQSSQLPQRQTQYMKTEADGEDCGGPEPARNSHPLLQPETEDQTRDSAKPETDDSADWKETREPQSALNSLKHDSRYVQQLLVVKEEVPPEQQECSASVDQKEPKPPPHIKEEQEELWSSQEGEQLQGLEEADNTKFSFTPVPVKSEDDEEEAQSSQLHQRKTQHMETEADVEDCGGPEPARNSLLRPETGVRYLRSHMVVHKEKRFSCSVCNKRFARSSLVKTHRCVGPMETEADGEDWGGPDPARNTHPLLQPETEDQPGDSNEPETDDSADWKETREPQSALNSLKHDSRYVQQMLVVKEEVPPEQQECSSSVDQQEPETPPHVKEEQEELWFSQEEEQLQGLEEADITKFPFTPVPVKSEDDEEEAQSLQLHQRKTQHMETEPARNSHPLLQPKTEPETYVSADWKETREPQSALNSLKHDSRYVQQLLVVKEEVPPEQQECSSSVDQEEPEAPPHIKEEQEELWSSQEGEHLKGLEEAEITKFPFTAVPVKSEAKEKEAQSSQLHQRRNQHMKTEADGEDCGGRELARNSHPLLQPETGDSSETETGDMK
ncbi:involucrin-like [Etheostoma cragini]|uniref:involucrin-like n=1 Tax=Etheostoma cragini TaxID=417921 RepID=UPI00155E365C|nr:involucrin-like [Etheostoma cragini]